VKAYIAVIPANAGIHLGIRFIKYKSKMDSGLTSPSAVESRWNDEL